MEYLQDEVDTSNVQRDLTKGITIMLCPQYLASRLKGKSIMLAVIGYGKIQLATF